MKSFFVRPSIALPSLSVTTTLCTTRRVSARNVGVAGACAAGGVCCPESSVAEKTRTTSESSPRRMVSTSEAYGQPGVDLSHRPDAGRQSELRAQDHRFDAGVDDAIEQVGG